MVLAHRTLSCRERCVSHPTLNSFQEMSPSWSASSSFKSSQLLRYTGHSCFNQNRKARLVADGIRVAGGLHEARFSHARSPRAARRTRAHMVYVPPEDFESQTHFIMKRPVSNTPPSIARLAIGGADSVFENEQERPLTSCDGGCRSPPTR